MEEFDMSKERIVKIGHTNYKYYLRHALFKDLEVEDSFFLNGREYIKIPKVNMVNAVAYESPNETIFVDNDCIVDVGAIEKIEE